jgi:hypothetical protein
MAATLLGDGAPLTSFNYRDSFENGKSASISQLWHSSASTIGERVQEILDATEWQLGEILVDDAFVGLQVVARDVSVVNDSDKNIYSLQVTFGPIVRTDASISFNFTFSSSVSAAQTNIDAAGAFITVGTITGSGDPLPATPPYTTVPKTGATVEKLFPSVQITASGRSDTNPFSTARDMVGKLNSDAVTMAGSVFAAGTLMLTGLNISSPDNGETFNIDYTFEYRKDPLDWYAVVVAIDPKTGKPYQGIGGTVFKVPGGDVTKGTPGVTDGSLGYRMYDNADIGSLVNS